MFLIDKAVLSALRALQAKISAMSKEQQDMEYKYSSEISKLEHENADLKAKYQETKQKLKDMMRLNEGIYFSLYF